MEDNYLLPGALISPPEVSLKSRLRAYGLKEAAWQQGLTAFSDAIAVFPEALAPTLITFTLLPVVQRFFPTAASKPALHLAGTTGSGKREIAALMASFYGRFTKDMPPSQWGDTGYRGSGSEAWWSDKLRNKRYWQTTARGWLADPRHE